MSNVCWEDKWWGGKWESLPCGVSLDWRIVAYYDMGVWYVEELRDEAIRKTYPSED